MMNKKLKKYIQISIVILDFSFLNISFILSAILFEKWYTSLSTIVENIWASMNLIWLAASFFLGVYGNELIKNFEYFIKRTLQVYFCWVSFFLFYLVWTKNNSFLPSHILLNLIIFGLGLVISRFIYSWILNYLKAQNNYRNKVMILGFNETGKKLASYLEEEGLNIELLGFSEDQYNVKELSNYPILCSINKAIATAKKMEVTEIFSTITPSENKNISSMIREAEKNCLRFKIVPNIGMNNIRPIVIDYIKDLPILSLRNDPLEDVGNRIKKRFLDIIISLVVTIFILSWLIPIIGLLILLESKGPIFFKQLRTGINDKSFNCLKFRSMKLNGDSDTKSATKNDGRITKIGGFLRKTSLDEFPQFINVLLGEMSLVGPRPHMLKHTFEFSKTVNHYMVRQLLKPGITGWAQVNNLRGEIRNQEDIKKRVESDLWYLENWTIWLDIRIIFMTIYHVFSLTKNAY
jgi:putative colanic acid biosynthesis UDP-glucose lipid carrier transferase